MQLTPTTRNAHFIRSYDRSGVSVGDRQWQRSVLISEQQIADWPVTRIEQLTPTHLDLVFALQPEIVILTTGLAAQVFPDKAIRAAFMSRNIGLECMELGAACRTFNVLLSEARPVVLALLLDN